MIPNDVIDGTTVYLTETTTTEAAAAVLAGVTVTAAATYKIQCK